MKVLMKNNLMVGAFDEIFKESSEDGIDYTMESQLVFPLKDLFTKGEETSREEFFENLRGKMLFAYARGIEHLRLCNKSEQSKEYSEEDVKYYQCIYCDANESVYAKSPPRFNSDSSEIRVECYCDNCGEDFVRIFITSEGFEDMVIEFIKKYVTENTGEQDKLKDRLKAFISDGTIICEDRFNKEKTNERNQSKT